MENKSPLQEPMEPIEPAQPMQEDDAPSSSTSNRELNCAVARDLLPLYHDGVVTKTTEEILSAHLQGCKDCAAEYKKLCMVLDLNEQKHSPKVGFFQLMRKKKKKNRLILLFSALLACVLLVSGYFLQLQFPILPLKDEEITVLSVYRYETEQEYRYFVLLSHPYYDYMHTDYHATSDGTLAITVKRPLLSQKHDELGMRSSWLIISCGSETADDGSLIKYTCDQVVLGEQVLWDAEANEADTVPEYVYVYDQFEHEPGSVSYCTFDEVSGCFSAYFPDGSCSRWDKEGHLLEHHHGESHE